MKSLKINAIAVAATAAIGTLTLTATTTSFAQNAIWLPAPGSGSLALSYASAKSDRFYVGDSLMALPFGTIKQNTTTLSGIYSVVDGVAIDAKLGFARRTSGISSDSASDDTRLGVTWRFLDEYENRGAPTVAVRVGAIFKGDYETKRPDSIGDGGSGFEASVLVGKYVTSSLGLRGELGFRNRNKGIPNQTYLAIGADYRITPALVGSLGYTASRKSGGLDIGGPGFSPDKFQQVAEKRGVFNVGVGYAVTQRVGLNLNYGKVTSGRNTKKDDVLALGVSFDL